MQQMDRESTWQEMDFARFYQHFASPLLDYLRLQTRSLEDAEDILVEVFLAARQNERIAREVPAGQSAWLRQVARNKLVDYYRRQGQATVFPLDEARGFMNYSSADNPELALLQNESLARLQAAVRSLPEPQQELLRLRFSEDLRCPQIAMRMGKRAGAVRAMLVRTLKALRAIYSHSQEV